MVKNKQIIIGVVFVGISLIIAVFSFTSTRFLNQECDPYGIGPERRMGSGFEYLSNNPTDNCTGEYFNGLVIEAAFQIRIIPIDFLAIAIGFFAVGIWLVVRTKRKLTQTNKTNKNNPTFYG